MSAFQASLERRASEAQLALVQLLDTFRGLVTEVDLLQQRVLAHKEELARLTARVVELEGHIRYLQVPHE